MGMDIRWVLDTDRSRAESVADAFRIPIALAADQLDMAAPADIVVLACPYGVRAPYYDMFRDRGDALFIEKPIARSDAEFERICRLRPDYAIAAGFYRRTLGAVKIVKGICDSGLLGRLRHIRSEFGTATVISSGGSFARDLSLAGGGQLFESAIHNIDAICHITGANNAAVLECRMEAESGFDLHTEATIELTGARAQKIEFELLVTCFRTTNNGITFEFDNGAVEFSLFRTTRPQIRSLSEGPRFEITDPLLDDAPRETYEALYCFWRDFVAGLDARTLNYTNARSSAVTTSILEQLYRTGCSSKAGHAAQGGMKAAVGL